MPCAQGETEGQEPGVRCPVGGDGSIPAAEDLGWRVRRFPAVLQRGWGHTRCPLVSWHSTHVPFAVQVGSEFYSTQGIKMPTNLGWAKQEKGERDPLPSIPPCVPGGAALSRPRCQCTYKTPTIFNPQKLSAILIQCLQLYLFIILFC